MRELDPAFNRSPEKRDQAPALQRKLPRHQVRNVLVPFKRPHAFQLPACRCRKHHQGTGLKAGREEVLAVRRKREAPGNLVRGGAAEPTRIVQSAEQAGGSARKYLLYALGEIALVVIGILIALQINNWNLEKQDRKDELKFLNKFYKDIQADSLTLVRQKETSRIKSQLLTSMIDNSLRSFEKKGSRQVESIFLSRNQAQFSPSDNSFNEIISSGRISIIQNENLKEQLFDYYRYIEERNDVLSRRFSDWPR